MSCENETTNTAQALIPAVVFCRRVRTQRKLQKQEDAQERVIALGVFSILNNKEL